MAAIALTPMLDTAPNAADWAALELGVHGRSRDASRPAEAWAGVTVAMRTITSRVGAMSAAQLGDRIGTSAIDAGLIDRVVPATVADVERARSRGARRLLAIGAPCAVLSLRLAEPALGLEQLHVLGTVSPSADVPAGHTCPACDDPLNALADLSLGTVMPQGLPLALVRNARGRALLDALAADVWLDAVPADAYRATAEVAQAAWHGRYLRVMP